MMDVISFLCFLLLSNPSCFWIPLYQLELLRSTRSKFMLQLLKLVVLALDIFCSGDMQADISASLKLLHCSKWISLFNHAVHIFFCK